MTFLQRQINLFEGWDYIWPCSKYTDSENFEDLAKYKLTDENSEDLSKYKLTDGNSEDLSKYKLTVTVFYSTPKI